MIVLIPRFEYSGSTAISPRSMISGRFIAFSRRNSAAGVSLPPDFCTAFAIDGKHSQRQTSLLFLSRMTATCLMSMMSIKFEIIIFFIPSVNGTVP